MAQEQGASGNFDIRSFISRIDALYDAQDKKNPARERPAWQKNAAPLKRQTTKKPNTNDKRPLNNRRDQSKQRDTKKAAGEEKLELHVDPSVPPAYKRGPSVMNFTRTTKADGQRMADKVYGFRGVKDARPNGNNSRYRKSAGAKVGGQRRGPRRDNQRGSREGKLGGQQQNVADRLPSSLTTQQGLDMVMSLVKSSHNGFVPVKDVTSSELITSNLPPSAITYETKVWTAIREAEQSKVSATDKETLQNIIKQNVKGDGVTYNLKPGLGLNGVTLVNGINSNPTFNAAARMKLGDFASKKQIAAPK